MRGRSAPLAGAVVTAVTTIAILSVVKLMAPYQMLIADRFLPGSGWAEILLLSAYAAFVVHALITRFDTSRIRLTIWLVFSVVFFTQLILGVSAIDRFLMTGRLHVPVPAVVIAGPVFRGERFFMPILFLSTVLLVGPAWCSFLCYFGPWDGLSASRVKRAGGIGKPWRFVRFSIFALTPAAALVLRLTGAKGTTAAIVAIGFGLAGLGISALVSSRHGTMVHCTSICPLGLCGNILGKISPFRINIDDRCTDCGRCIPSCRYNALSAESIAQRRPGYTCTLCGDCLSACPHRAISYRFLRADPAKVRTAFFVVVVALHAVFLGVARI